MGPGGAPIKKASMTDLPIIRTSERGTLRRCPQLWKWRYLDGLTPTGKQADARWFGIGIHIALAEWYGFKGKRRGPHPAETFDAWYGDEIAWVKTQSGDEFDTPVWEDAHDLGIAMLEGYVEQWGKDSQWQVLAVEQPFSVKVTRAGEPVAIFRSRWDGLVRDLSDGRVKLLEHKTAGSISTAYLELDDQAGSYWAVAGPVLKARKVLEPDEEIDSIIYNFLRKAMPDDRPKNAEGLACNKPTKDHYVRALNGIDGWDATQLVRLKLDELDSISAANHLLVLGEVSKVQPKPLFVREEIRRSWREQATQMGRLADEVTVMNGMRDGSIPITKSTGKECTFCDFFDMCRLHERGGNAWKSLARSLYAVTDPYSDDVKSASGDA